MKFTLSFFGLILAMAVVSSPKLISTNLKAGDLTISQASRDLILYYEVGGAAEYVRTLQHPEVPPGASGITIGIGCDCGYNTAAQIRDDWAGKLPPAQVERLASVAGKTQGNARAALSRVRDIRIPYDTAVEVYESRTVPRFAKLTKDTYPGVTNTNPDIQGVMLSTTFNRGNSLSGDRRRELRWCRDDIQANKVEKLSSYQLQMRRLWPTIKGLQRRYTAHAGLIDNSLAKP